MSDQEYSIMGAFSLIPLTVVQERDAEIKRLREIINTRLPDQGRQIKAMKPIIDAARDLMETDHPDHYWRLENALAAYDNRDVPGLTIPFTDEEQDDG